MANNSPLGIYKDAVASGDTNWAPANREGEMCLSCGELIVGHCGWACRHQIERVKRKAKGLPWSPIPYDECEARAYYWTESMMKAGENPHSPKAVKTANPIRQKLDTDDWRSWQHQVVGDCPCGIAKKSCEYHR